MPAHEQDTNGEPARRVAPRAGPGITEAARSHRDDSRPPVLGPVTARRLQSAAGNRAVAALIAQRRTGQARGPTTTGPTTAVRRADIASPEVEAVQRLAPDGNDHKLAALRSEVRGRQRALSAHQPPATAARAAQAAAEPPQDDKQAQGKAANAEKMNATRPGGFDKSAFIEAVNDAIAAQTPKNLDEADSFSRSGKADAVKGQVQGKVTEGRKQSAAQIETATKASPDTSAAKEKPVTPLRPGRTAATPAAPNPANAVPDKAPGSATDFSAGPQQVDSQMAAAQVTDEQLATSNEPEFTGALNDKQAGERHAAGAPAQVRGKEAQTLAATRAGALQQGTAAMQTMVAANKGTTAAVASGQHGARGSDEAKRAQVAGTLQKVFDATQKDVVQILDGLDSKVDDAFTRGEQTVRDAFTADHRRRMDAYKEKRYSGWSGKARWVADKFTGLPDEANQIFAMARQGYEAGMRQVISGVADLIGAELNRAKQRIAAGRDHLRAEVAKLPRELQAIGRQAAGGFSAKFDELTSSVDAKGKELVDTLASKYNDALKAVDAEIEAEKEKNKGLIAKAVEAVGGVIKTILQLKDLLLGVLAKAGQAVMAILKDPIGFLGSLVSTVGAGLRNFMNNMGTHLQKGLVGWLLGAMSGAGLQMPGRFDLRGILAMVASLLGLTWTAIRGRIVAKGVPEHAMSAVEAGVPLVAKLQSEGVAGVAEDVKEQVGDLKENLLGKISKYLIPTVLIAGITWIISLLNPASAFIKACKMIIDIVSFILDRGAQIIAFVNAVLDAVIAIAGGGAGGVPGLIETALAKSIPVLIGALAAILGIGGIANKVKSFFQALAKPVTKAVDWIVAKVVRLGKAIWNKLKAAGGKIKDRFGRRTDGRPGPAGRSQPPASGAADPRTLAPDELALHKRLAQTAARDLQQAEPGTPYEQVRQAKAAKARQIEAAAQPQLRPGLHLTVTFAEQNRGKPEAKMRFHVRIAPNDTDLDGAVPLEPDGPATPMGEVPHDFFHGTDRRTAGGLAGRTTIEARGRGEFGAGFYTFADQTPAELAAAQYTRNRRDGATAWGVVRFGVPVPVLHNAGLLEAVTHRRAGNYVLVFPDRDTAVDVRYPDEIAPNVTRSMTWKEFRDENRRLGGQIDWGYDLIVGPLSGTLPGFRNVDQFLFHEQGLYALNDPAVTRRMVAEGAV